jgi:hypothetical protein
MNCLVRASHLGRRDTSDRVPADAPHRRRPEHVFLNREFQKLHVERNVAQATEYGLPDLTMVAHGQVVRVILREREVFLPELIELSGHSQAAAILSHADVAIVRRVAAGWSVAVGPDRRSPNERITARAFLAISPPVDRRHVISKRAREGRPA